MNKDDLIAMSAARQTADVTADARGRETFSFDEYGVKAFAKLIEARTREECAAACDDVEEPAWYGYECPNTFQDGRSACASAIRAMGERT